MSMDDPGWDYPDADQGKQEPARVSEQPTIPAGGAGTDAYTAPAWQAPGPGAAPGYPPGGPTGGPPPQPPPPPGRKGPNKVLIGGGVGVVVIVVIVVLIVALSGGSSNSSSTTGTTTGQHSGTSTTIGSSGSAGSQTSTGSSGTTGSSGQSASQPLMSVLPSAFASTCQSLPAAQRGAGASDEVVCDVSQVPSAGGRFVIYERFPSTDTLTTQYGQLLSSNGVTAGQGDCSEINLTGSAPNGSFCEQSYTQDSNNSQGQEMLFVGSDFQLGGSTVTELCQSAGVTASGVTVLVATSPSDLSASAVIACNSNGSYASQIHQDFLAGNYELND